MLSWKSLVLCGTLCAAPLMTASEASADHTRHFRYRPGCDYGPVVPGFHSSFRYRSGFGYAPRVYARPPISPFVGVPRFPYGYGYGYGAGYPWYGAYGTGFGVGPRGFSLYIGR